MAYNDFLADRMRQFLQEKYVSFEEKEMMGGLIFMVDDKMCVGIIKDSLMARIDPEVYEDALTRKACREMDFTGRSMKGFVFISPDGTKTKEDLNYWIDLALEYNKIAKASRKRKK